MPGRQVKALGRRAADEYGVLKLPVALHRINVCVANVVAATLGVNPEIE